MALTWDLKTLAMDLWIAGTVPLKVDMGRCKKNIQKLELQLFGNKQLLQGNQISPIKLCFISPFLSSPLSQWKKTDQD